MTAGDLSTPRLNIMRAGYAFMGVGLAIVVVIAAVIPWGYAWRQYARTPGDAWR